MSWNLADLVEQVTDALPTVEAVVSGAIRWTYAELDERAERAARLLADRGVEAGDHVGLALGNGPVFLELLLGAFKLRAVPVNLNVRYTAEELRYLVDDADLVGVVHEADLAETVAEATEGAARVGWLLAASGGGGPSRYEEALAAGPAPSRPVRPDRSGDDPYLLYTGGTTGLPKGVEWRHHDLLVAALGGGNPGGPPVVDQADLVANAAAVAGRTRCLPASPFVHGTAQWTALSTLLSGGTVVVDPSPGLDPASLWDLVEGEAVTHLIIVGDAFARPLADALDAAPDRWDLSHLLVVVSGGAVLSRAGRRGLLAHLPGAVVVDGYGTSETGGQGNLAAWPGQPEDRPAGRFSVGEDTAVLDDDLRPVEPGSGRVGRLARRRHVPIRYRNDPERTARTFPTVDGVRWAVPGDLATVEEDGTVTLLGRGSSSINSGGEKVHPIEVEAVLKDHPDVFDAVVVGVPDVRWGERVAAAVQLRPGSPLAEGLAPLEDHCRRHLAGFKVPRTVVVVDRLVRLSTGKPDHAWTRAVVAAAPGPGSSR